MRVMGCMLFMSLKCGLYFQAAGGSGRYSWTSDATTIASVNTRGLLTTTTDTGVTEVKAHDSANAMHFGVAQVHSMTVFLSLYSLFMHAYQATTIFIFATFQVNVLPPDNLKFVPSKVEVEIGTKLKLPVAAAAYLTPGKIKIDVVSCVKL